MYLNFHVYHLTNLFFFVFHLSECHFSASQGLREEWLERTGPLSNEENILLEKFKEMVNKQTGDYPYFEERFFSSRLKAGDKTSQEIHRTLQAFSPRFKKIWLQDKPRLLYWQNKLLELTDSPKMKKSLGILARFFGTKPSQKAAKVFLLAGLSKHVGGFAVSKKQIIALECSSVPPHRADALLELLTHELAHLLFDKGKYKKMLNRKTAELKKNLDKEEVFSRPIEVCINEVVFTNLVNGYLGQKFFNRNLKSFAEKRLAGKKKITTYSDWLFYGCLHMLDKTRDYLESKEQINAKYLDNTCKLLEETTKGRLH
ncbi:hypothetical protein KKB83_04345 [Patescibacteria group bacterium]|nr:hypothetical protein [Patescibacteria group bacterium]